MSDRCNYWMPRAKENCAGPLNHKNDHRTAKRVQNDIARFSEYKRNRYNSDETFRELELDRMQKRRAKSRKNDPEKHKKILTIANAKQRAKKLGIPFDLTLNSTPDIPDYCPVLGIPLVIDFDKGLSSDNNPSLDRVIPAQGYVTGNVVWISWRANRLKSDANAWELEQLARYVKDPTAVCEVKPHAVSRS
jgi:hypothetical protein